MNSSSDCFSFTPSCPSVCEDNKAPDEINSSKPVQEAAELQTEIKKLKERISALEKNGPAEPLTLPGKPPQNDQEMVKVFDAIKEDKLITKYPFVTPSLIAATGIKEWDEDRWLQIGFSVYGIAIWSLLINIEFKSIFDLFLVFLLFGQQVFIIGGVQGYILYWLWKSLPASYDVDLCTTDNLFFYVCIIGVFFISMIPDLFIICNEYRIIRSGLIYFQPLTGSFPKLFRDPVSVILAYLVLSYEFLVWIAVVLVGINYILVSETLGDLVQAAVAITFINELDDMAAFLYGGLAERIRVAYFRCDKPTFDDNASVFFSTLLTMPVLVSISCGIIYGIYNSYC
jgi:hypothetical protein